MMDKIGLIAGSGRFPVLFAQEARRTGVSVVATGIKGITEASLEREVDSLHLFKLGQLDKPIRLFQQEGVTQAVMAGKVNHNNLFFNILPDMRTIKLLARLKDRRADSILRGIADEFEREGIRLVPSTTFLTHLVPQTGHLTRRRPDKGEETDVALGWKVAKSISALDVGMTVVVAKGVVLSVEAMEGTDACILRAGELVPKSQSGLVVVKVARPNQDLRFDLPVLGLDSLKAFASARVGVLAIESGRSLILDKDEFLKQADLMDLAIVGIDKDGI